MATADPRQVERVASLKTCSDFKRLYRRLQAREDGIAVVNFTDTACGRNSYTFGNAEGDRGSRAPGSNWWSYVVLFAGLIIVLQAWSCTLPASLFSPLFKSADLRPPLDPIADRAKAYAAAASVFGHPRGPHGDRQIAL